MASVRKQEVVGRSQYQIRPDKYTDDAEFGTSSSGKVSFSKGAGELSAM